MDMQSQPQSSTKEQTRFGFNRDTDNFLNTLFPLWDKLGMDESQKKTRAEKARQHVKHLMENMIAEEEELMERVAKTIVDYTEKLNRLSEELSVIPLKVPSNLTMVQKEKFLRNKVDQLNKDKTERMTKYKELHTKDQELCDMLSSTPYYLPPGAVPSQAQLKECEQHVNQLQTEKEKRFALLVDTKRKIIDLYNTMGTDPDTSFGHDLMCEDDGAFQLSPKNMDHLKDLLETLTMMNDEMVTEAEDLWERLRALWNRLDTPDIDREAFEASKEGHSKIVIDALKAEIQACEKLKFENMRKFIDGIRTELKSWWDRCYLSHDERNNFKLFSSDEYTEDVLTAHERELENIRAYYNSAKDLFEKLAHRDELFKKMTIMEEEANDVNRYKNRGGKLLQEEKARKKVLKELPKVEEDVGEAIKKWEAEKGKVLYLKGMRYPHFIEQEWNDYSAHKEQQKQSRLQARARQTHDEMLYGTKSSISFTPGKRKQPAIATPVRTPLKTRKINDIIRTPNTTSKLPNQSRFQHSTMISSPFSRKPLYTPKTPNNTNSRKRRSIRLIQKAATERRVSKSRRKSREATFSCSTISSDEHGVSTVGVLGSYTDFANGLGRPNCRSSVAPSAQPFAKH